MAWYTSRTWFDSETPRWPSRRLSSNTSAQDGYLCKVRLPQDPGQAGKAQVAYLQRALAGFATVFLPVTGDKDTQSLAVRGAVRGW